MRISHDVDGSGRSDVGGMLGSGWAAGAARSAGAQGPKGEAGAKGDAGLGRLDPRGQQDRPELRVSQGPKAIRVRRRRPPPGRLVQQAGLARRGRQALPGRAGPQVRRRWRTRHDAACRRVDGSNRKLQRRRDHGQRDVR